MQPNLNTDPGSEDDVERGRRAQQASQILGIDLDKVLAFMRAQEQLGVSNGSLSGSKSASRADEVVNPPQLWEGIPPSTSQGSDASSHSSLSSHRLPVQDGHIGHSLVSTQILSPHLQQTEQYRLPPQQHEYSKEWQLSHQNSMFSLDNSFDAPQNAFRFDLASYPSIYALPGSHESFTGFGESSVEPSMNEDNMTAALDPKVAFGSYNGMSSAIFGVEDTLNSPSTNFTGNTTNIDLPGNLTSRIDLPNSSPTKNARPSGQTRLWPITPTHHDLAAKEFSALPNTTLEPSTGDTLINTNDYLSVERPNENGLNFCSNEKSVYSNSSAIPTNLSLEPYRDFNDDALNNTSIVPTTGSMDNDFSFLCSMASDSNANHNQTNLWAATQSRPLASSHLSQPAMGDSQQIENNQSVKSSELSLVSLQPPSSLLNLAPIAPKRKAESPILLNVGNVAAQTAKAPIQKKQRGTYTEARRSETNRTRQLVSCIRCHAQRIRCKPNPEDEALPCVQCLTSKPRLFSLGCLRYKISDSILFRTGVAGNAFYQSHPMTGRNYGDFTLQATRKWVGDQIHFLEITQDRGTVCRLEIRQFDPPEALDGTDSRNRSIFLIPWAIADADKATTVINKFLDDSLSPYINCLLEEEDHLVWEVFHTASSNAYLPNQPVDELQKMLLRHALRLWVGCRFVEGKWHCVGEDKLGAAKVKSPYRSPDWVSVPPYIDYQFASVVMHRVLEPLRVATLRTLQRLVEGNKPKDWYTIVLVTFVLLHNYERGIFFQRGFWAKRKVPVLYLDMELIRGIHSGAKAILAHFHYACKGNLPFAPDFNWDSREARRMAEINQEQVQFMMRLRVLARQKADEMGNVSDTHQYETPYWFTSQIFEGQWRPRDTLEHSPEASPWPPAPVFGPILPPENGVSREP